MTAGKYDITIEQGSDFSLTLNIKQGGVARNLSGYTARGSMRKTYDATTAHDFTFGALDSTGVISMAMSHADTAQLDAEFYVYDVEIYTGTGEASDSVTRLLQGKAEVTREVTRA
jgi:hypothetical protein